MKQFSLLILILPIISYMFKIAYYMAIILHMEIFFIKEFEYKYIYMQNSQKVELRNLFLYSNIWYSLFLK